MLYNPKWETPAEVYSLDGLIAWLETRPADATYNFDDCSGRCLICQYLTAREEDWANYGTFTNRFDDSVARTWPWTFGAALDRARKIAGRS